MSSIKILSCIPKQAFTFSDKVAWAEYAIKMHKPELMILPQEYFGGIQQEIFKTGEPLVYPEEEVLKPMKGLSKKYSCGILFGALIKDDGLGQTRERIYGVDSSGKLAGFQDKIFLPAYDHIEAGGIPRVSPEVSFSEREAPIIIDGVRVGILFCWEVFSGKLWRTVAQGQPDIIANMIKFGIKGYPQKSKNAVTGQSLVTGFGFGKDGGWFKRLEMAATYDVSVPIISSTNSWNLPCKSRPICGTIFPWTTKEQFHTVANPLPTSNPMTGELIVLDNINYLDWRHVREDKRNYFAQLNEWPSAESRYYTMMWKIKRLEKKIR